MTGTLRSVAGKSVPKGFRARDRMERDSIAASFRFNDVVDELQAKLATGERLLPPVVMVRSGLDQGALVSNQEAGAVKDQDLGVGSLVLEKLNLVLDNCLPEFLAGLLRIQIERGTMVRARVLGVGIIRLAGLAAVMVR